MPYFSPHKYVKDESSDPFYAIKQINYRFAARTRLIPSFFLSLGILIIITQIIIPLYFFTTSSVAIASPVSGSVLGLATGFSTFEFEELVSQVGATSAGNVPDKFYLTIPKLGITNAEVRSESINMSPDNFIGHYRGSALPGEKGNVFLYGHSVLPIFYNPTNYKTIFSTLNKLSSGDKFSVKYNNKDYFYKVETIEILSTDKVHPLAQVRPAYLNESTMVLMTCWPPGLKSKRLQVNAVMID